MELGSSSSRDGVFESVTRCTAAVRQTAALSITGLLLLIFTTTVYNLHHLEVTVDLMKFLPLKHIIENTGNRKKSFKS